MPNAVFRLIFYVYFMISVNKLALLQGLCDGYDGMPESNTFYPPDTATFCTLSGVQTGTAQSARNCRHSRAGDSVNSGVCVALAAILIKNVMIGNYFGCGIINWFDVKNYGFGLFCAAMPLCII